MEFRELTDQDFDTYLTGRGVPQVVLFWAPWSPLCESYQDALEELKVNYDARLEIFCMNVDENANIPATLGVSHIPMLAKIEHGVTQMSLAGRQSKLKIREFVEQVVEGGSHGRTKGAEGKATHL